MIPLEFSGNVAAASQVAKVVADARGQLSNGPLVEEIDAFLDCHARRLAAVGQPLVLEGLANFDGKPFDWSSYRGKVVLVCFWASWEINSLDEMRRLKELRRQIPSADFEILAINLDDTNMPGAEQMVFEQNYSWANVRSSNPAAQGFSTPAAVELGVNAVPFVMLVDRQGKVAAIHVRGQNTAQMVNELLTR
jgi:thiol-disulfide isomerase/thioredoxin